MITVGLAFLPSSHWQADAIDSRAQIALLDKVKQSFIKYDYIDRIEIIPSTYLKNGKGFDTLQQVARLHDVDVMALVSYDQLMQSHENKSAILYWTIVGMYVILGNENAIQTFVDTAVFDLAVNDMIVNLDDELARFKTRVKEEQVATIEHKQGYRGGGSLSLLSLFTCSLILNQHNALSR